MKPSIFVIVGARPQFIKHFPFEKAAAGKLNLTTIHTGQHYDSNMSAVFFKQLKMKKPDHILDIGSGNHGYQTGRMMMAIEKIVEAEKPSGMVVYGDTNSTLAGALVASKLQTPLFHIEAGLRSYNKEMPEEINRVLTDHIADLLFVSSPASIKNLSMEGIHNGIHEVGDIMKDIVRFTVEKKMPASSVAEGEYYYATLHRPYNTDREDRLKYILEAFDQLDRKVIFSLHPRTKNLLLQFGTDLTSYTNIEFIEPQAYFNNLTYLIHSKALITDSGGMQKEAYWLQKKCVTIRKETEWTETLNFGANTLVFEDLSQLRRELNTPPGNWDALLYGDGHSADKIVSLIEEYYK